MIRGASSDGRDQVGREAVVEVAAVAQLDLLDRGVADGLQRAAFDLALGEDRVDRAGRCRPRRPRRAPSPRPCRGRRRPPRPRPPSRSRVRVAAVGLVVELRARDRARTAGRCGRPPCSRASSRVRLARTDGPVRASTVGLEAVGRPASTRPPTTIAVRDATVGPQSGTIDGVLRRHLDVSIGDAELLGDELRKDRLGALPHLGRRGQDADRAVARSARRWRRWPAAPRPMPVNPAPCQASASPIPRAVAARPSRASARCRRRRSAAVRRGARARTRPPPRRARGPLRRRRSRAAPGRSASRRRRGRPAPRGLERGDARAPRRRG